MMNLEDVEDRETRTPDETERGPFLEQAGELSFQPFLIENAGVSKEPAPAPRCSRVSTHASSREWIE